MKPAPSAQIKMTTSEPKVTIKEFFKKFGNSPSAQTCVKLFHSGLRASSSGFALKLPVSRSDEFNKKKTGSKTITALITKTALKNVPVSNLLIIALPHVDASS